MIFIITLVVLVVVLYLYMKAWNQGKAKRQSASEAHRQQHGGQLILEWNGPQAQGPADAEFGELKVEIPKKSGSGSAKFYEKGFLLDGKRFSYETLKDVVFDPGGSGKAFTPKQKMRNSAVLWLYPKKGMAMGIRDFSYQFDGQTMERIRDGLGFKNS